MVKQHITESLRKFIKQQIQSVPRLEVLLLLHRHRSRSFVVAEVANELGFEIDTAHEQLAALQEAGLVDSNGDKPKYKYGPADRGLDAMVNQLAVAYPKQRVPILSAILTEDPSKVRRFVEAFKVTRAND